MNKSSVLLRARIVEARRRLRFVVASAALMLLTGCVSVPEHERLAQPAPEFSPLAFFSGRTVGEGTLDILLKPGRTPLHVAGEGRIESDGALVLVQRVRRGGEDAPPTLRRWRIEAGGGGNYRGTLSDAESPVVGEVRGNRLHLRFVADGGVDVEQWLYLQPGAKVALNRMVVRKFGLPVAAVEETIRKAD